MHYHPGAMLKGKWSCCKQVGKTSLGCQPTYHLLTRSSSRYAQMRRRDTLTSTQNSRKRARSSAGVFATLDRRSLATTSNRVSGSTEVQDGGQKSATVVGLSNSCVDLTMYPPHRVESFALEEYPSSQRSSQVSNEPSVGVASITLTRVSMSEATPTDCSHDFELDQYQAAQQSSKFDKWHSRSKVAPEGNFTITRNSIPSTRGQHSLEKKPTKLKQSPLTQSLDHPPHLQEKHSRSNDSRVSLSPVPPPRHKKLNPSLPNSLHNSVHYIPSMSTVSGSGLNIEQGTSSLGRLKHSKTFALSRSTDPVAEPHLRPHLKGFSHSMHTLSKPVIEPKLSLTNPNMVHV